MGILNGYKHLERFTTGFFFKNCDSYCINVDGEWARYRGLIESNRTLSDPEETIGETAARYLHSLIERLRAHFRQSARTVSVYMDGKRIRNKSTNRVRHAYDECLIRDVFKARCNDMGYEVIELDYGEAELEMYLRRDQTSELNVFITKDTDMLSICYGHTPKFDCHPKHYNEKVLCHDVYEKRIIEPLISNDRAYETTNAAATAAAALSPLLLNYKTDLMINDRWRTKERRHVKLQIRDDNFSYPKEDSLCKIANSITIQTRDSCVWVYDKPEHIVLIGLDMLVQKFKYSERVMHAFLATCGTDFTPSMLTLSMSEAFFNVEPSQIDFLNALEDWNEILAMIFYVCIRFGNGVLKRQMHANNDYRKIAHDDVTELYEMYHNYVSTGKMVERDIPPIDAANIPYRFIKAMLGDKFIEYKRAALTKAFKTVSPQEALDNFRISRKQTVGANSIGAASKVQSRYDIDRVNRVKRRLGFDDTLPSSNDDFYSKYIRIAEDVQVYAPIHFLANTQEIITEEQTKTNDRLRDKLKRQILDLCSSVVVKNTDASNIQDEDDEDDEDLEMIQTANNLKENKRMPSVKRCKSIPVSCSEDTWISTKPPITTTAPMQLPLSPPSLPSSPVVKPYIEDEDEEEDDEDDERKLNLNLNVIVKY